MLPPPHPIAAVVHPDPYPYYAELVARRPLYWDDALRLWVASGAEAVTAILSSPHVRVRPPAEPVPTALQGSPAGDLFGCLVRMNDGAGHRAGKQAVSAALNGGALAAPNGDALANPCRAQAQRLWDAGAGMPQGAALDAFSLRLPVFAVASLLGVPETALQTTAAQVERFVRCLAPGAAPEELARANEAAAYLLALGRSLLAGAPPTGSAGLMTALGREARRAGVEDADTVAANGVGLLSQTCEATAALIGNTLLALARDGALRRAVQGAPERLPALVREVARHDAPVQNTRRFLAQDATLAGQPLRAGDAVLVVLAAANRDPVANPHPERFEPARFDSEWVDSGRCDTDCVDTDCVGTVRAETDRAPRLFTFGLGAHACPGERLAVTIAAEGVRHLLRAGVDPEPLAAEVRYRPSANVRMPVFSTT